MNVLMTAGKGGTGKSMILAHLLRRRVLTYLPGPILVVDADPHQSLTRLLGIRPRATLGELRHRHNLSLRRGAGLEALSRRDFAAALAHQAVQPLNEHADLLVMGRNDQRGCQCVVNNILGGTLDALADEYTWVVMDNEAGVEHIGRHTWPVEVLFLVSSPKPLDLDVAGKILRQAQDTGREIRTTWLILNRHKGQRVTGHRLPAPLLGTLPYSEALDTLDAPDDAWLHALDDLWERAFRSTPALQFAPV